MGAYETLIADVRRNAWTHEAALLTKNLDRAPLGDIDRLLLSDREMFARFVLDGRRARINPKRDLEGMKAWVLRELEAERARYIETATSVELQARRVAVDDPTLKKIANAVVRKQPPVTIKTLQKAIEGAYNEFTGTGFLDEWVELWIEAGSHELPAERFTPAIQRAMVKYLRDIKLEPDRQKLKDPERIPDPANPGQTIPNPERFEVYDEFFSLAYEYARRRASSENDPIDVVRTKGTSFDWDFSVDLFEQIEEQGVVADNILAAGALDYIFWLGDYLGIYKIVDAIIVRWSAGAIDIGPGAGANLLYRYLKLRDERFSEEERAMLYKRVLARGDAPMLSRVVVNEMFPTLWHKLMDQAVEYIRKSEENDIDGRVSVTPLLQVAKDLQYNLSEHATGLLHMQVGEMYGHLQEAIEILRNEEILNHYAGGRRKNLWTVIERVAREEFGTAVNVAALRTIAVEGNKIFRWLADYDGRTAPRPALGGAAIVDAGFVQPLLDSAEAWIIAQADIEGQPQYGMDGEDLDEDVEADGTEDEFSDWND
jgi:hypothetical protein